jgi:transcriptional regulator with XRE-family HTH domain
MARTALSTKDVEIGARIRLARLQRSVTQQEMARSLKLTFQQVQKYEKGTNHVSAVRLHQIAGILGVGIDYFYSGLDGEAAQDVEPKEPVVSPSELVRTSESLVLLTAFNRIRSKVLRTCVLALVRSLVEKD